MNIKVIKFVLIVPAILIIAGFSIKSIQNTADKASNPKVVIEIPDDVRVVLDKSCVACHSDEASNAKAKLKVTFDKFESGEYSPGKVIGKLNNIVESIDDGSMPPEKFLQKYPDKKLSKIEANLIKTWANNSIKKLTEE